MTAQGCLIVDEPGLLTTVQDEGRWGWQHLGVPVGGPMDAASFRRANRLVGNVPGAATLEITLVGPTLEIVGPVTLALAGAPFDARLDGHALAPEAPVHVERRAWLAIGARRRGARAYLAVRGGLDTPVVLGSRSTSSGVPGTRAVQRGDVLPVAPAATSLDVGVRHARAGRGAGQGGATGAPPASTETVDAPPLRVLACDLDDDGAALATLCGGTYEIGTQSNRMGYRLHGPRVPVTADGRFSAGTVAGMLQVPPDGQPILLMADRQTTGGYPVVGVVIAADVPRAGQLAPGDRCTFAACTRQAAMAALLAGERTVLDG
jgi:antagonist of KipI